MSQTGRSAKEQAGNRRPGEIAEQPHKLVARAAASDGPDQEGTG